jgi:hypothetical protein
MSNEKLQEEIIGYIKSFFQFNRIDIKKYDPFKAGLFYMSKEGLINEDWDIFGCDL